MSKKTYNVLFLCTGNSGRSIIAEAVLRRHGLGKFKAFSAGSHPRPAPDPMVLEELERRNYDTAALRSKDWDEFARADSPPLHFIITVCDRARGEACPVWPGRPMSAHWGLADPHAFEGSAEERRWLVRRLIRELENRIKIFVSLPIAQLDRVALQSHLDELGNPEDAKRLETRH